MLLTIKRCTIVNKNDNELGMGRKISRRDFIHKVLTS